MRFSLVFSLLLLSFSSFFSTLSTAQNNYVPGYIVDNSGDTTHGYIEYYEWAITPSKISFKKETNTDPVVYHADDLLAFQLNNYIYQSRFVTLTYSPRSPDNALESATPKSESSKLFLFLLIDGNITFYKYFDQFGNDHYYIETPTDSIDELLYFKYYQVENDKRILHTNNKYKGQLLFHLRACNTLKSQILDAAYEPGDLHRVITSYYNCTGDTITYQYRNTDNFSAKRKRSRVKIGLFAGVSTTKISFVSGEGKYNYVLRADFKNSTNPVFGIQINAEPAKANGRWGIIMDVLVKSYSFSANYTNTWDVSNYDSYDMKMAATYLSVNPMWRYYFSKTRIKPYLNAGGYLASVLTKVDEMYHEKDVNGVITSENSTVFDDQTRRFDYGFTIGGGVKIYKFNLDIRYNYGGTSIYPVNSNTQSILFMLGFIFN
ncbi:MAG: porin family protein [Bacteroidales bacterium]|jgi:hypothetical protein|nr:porin family protein [Bacteroidales bacterium]